MTADDLDGTAASPRSSAPLDRHALIVDNLGLAEHLARRFANRGEPLEDLVQTASLALVRAAERFDPSLGFEFSTFATRTILGELKHHFRDKGWSVKAPRRLQELYLQVNVAIAELTQRLGRSPTVREVAAECGRREDEVLAAIEAGQGYRAASLDAPSPEGDSSREVPVDGGYGELEHRDELASHLSRLPRRERELLRLRFVDDLSQSEIAAQLGISQMHVSRLLRRALDALRASYREDASE
jgi:RNA polymerase sigma-B factor